MSTVNRPPLWEDVRPQGLPSAYEEMLRHVGSQARHEARIQDALEAVLAESRRLSERWDISEYECRIILEASIRRWAKKYASRWPRWLNCGPRTPNSPSGEAWKGAVLEAAIRAAVEARSICGERHLGATLVDVDGAVTPALTWRDKTLPIEVVHDPENDPVSLAWASLYHERRLDELAAAKAASPA